MGPLRQRGDIESLESHVLAPYAQKVSESRGRTHPQPEHPWRTDYQRDVARIIHSAAFRRLEYKTQVFLNGTGDHYRTRLTHTMEVASTGRTMARALGLNEDLVEAVALAHDLGHTPFGHSGEETLNRLLANHGGFNHNEQSLRVITLLECPYEDFDGLNLTFEVLEGVQKHAVNRSAPGLDAYFHPSLEGQIADIADEISYYAHDLQDGLEAGLIHAAQLSDATLCHRLAHENSLDLAAAESKPIRLSLSRLLSNHLIHDVIESTAERLQAADIHSSDAVRRHPNRLADYTRRTAEETRELRAFLYENLYYHPEIRGANQRACDMMAAVYDTYLRNPEQIGREATRRVPNCGLHRAAADYIAGMTDRYLLREHIRLFHPAP